jgi:MoxR-like ATPase
VASWPFVGRDEELEWAAAARKHTDSVGLIFSGEAGVGKTRLAREVLAAAAADGTHPSGFRRRRRRRFRWVRWPGSPLPA